MYTILILPPVRLIREQLLSTEYDRRNLLLTIVARCVHNTCDKVVREAGRGD